MYPKQELILPKSLSKFSPKITENAITRTETISTLLHQLESYNTVLIEGPRNIGKTTLLSQIANEYLKDSIVLFIDDKKKLKVTDSHICKDLYLQVKSIVDPTADLTKLINKKVTLEHLKIEFDNLQYFLKVKGITITFILDDVIDLELKDEFIAKLFLTLPFDRNIRFLISSSSNSKTKYIPDGFRSYSVNVLSQTEVMAMVPNCNQNQAKSIIRQYGGMPDKIAALSRLVGKGESVEDILNNNCNGAFELYEYEYDLEVTTPLIEDLLGVITFSQGKVSKSQLEVMLDLSSEELAALLESVSFVISNNEEVDFVSQGHYSFLSSKLKAKRIRYIDLHIEYYEKRKSKKNLPEIIRYYSQKGDSSSLIEQLSDEHIFDIYEQSSSIAELARSVQIGLNAATSINDEHSTNRFNLLKCALTNINKSEAIVSELECYLTEGDHSKALTLIESNGSYEEKLQLYCIYAIYQKKNELELRKNVLEKINFLFEKVEKTKLSVERASDIAADLLPVFPEKALTIINSLDELDSAGQNKSDAAFYKMSLLTLSRHGESLGDDLGKLSTTDDKRAEMFKSVEIFNPDSPAEKILEHISHMSESGDKIFILRAWILKNFSKPASVELLEKLLDLAIDSTDFAIDARFFSDISKVISTKSHIATYSEEINRSYLRILSHLETLQTKGPTVEYVKLIINVCNYELISNVQNKRIDNLYAYLSEMSDKSIALTSLSILSLNLKELKREDIEHDINLTKERLFSTLLATDAYHVDIFKEAIEHEAIYDLSKAIEWSERLNTLDRRSKAISFALKAAFDSERFFNKYRFNDIVTLLRKIKSESIREDIYESFIDYYFKFYNSNANYRKLQKVVNKIKSNFVKSKCLIRMLKFAKNSDKNTIELSKVWEQLDESISSTDGFENKIELYFSAHQKLYSIDVEAAREFKEKALQLKSKNFVKVTDFALFNKACLDLSIRCIYELEKASISSSEDIDFVASKIALLGSDIDKAYYLTRLVSCFQKSKNTAQADKVIESSLIPLLDSFDDKESKEFAMCCYHSLPVLFFYQYEHFLKYFSSVDELYSDLREAIIMATTVYSLNNCLIYDPYKPIKKNNYPNVSFKSIREVCKLFLLTQDENTLVVITRKILDALKNLKRRSVLSKVQCEEVIGLITATYEKLPFSGGLNHDGYKVLLQCMIKSLDEKYEALSWEELMTLARQIPNHSDRALLLCEIANLLPEKSLHQKKALFTESESLIKNLSSELEKLNRYSLLCENSLEVDKKVSQRFYKSALELCAKGSSSSSKEAKLKFIDMVSRFDETFSSSLATMYDDDPARVKSINDAIKRKKEKEELENKFKKSAKQSDDSLAVANQKIAKVAWTSLGDLNARSSHFNKSFELNKIIEETSEYSIEYYYKVLSFYIHYLAEVYPGESNLKEYISPMFQNIKSNILTVSKLFSLEEQASSEKLEDSSREHIVISLGSEETEKAKRFLRGWFSATKAEEITVIDPYFDYKSVEIIAYMINRDPDITVNIVTSSQSFKRLQKEGDEFIADTFKRYWTENIANGSLPSFKLQAIRYGTNNGFPIHDRWIYTETEMLFSGASLNGYGHKVCQIKKLTGSEMISTIETLTPLINGKQKYYNEAKMYSSYDEV